MCVCIKLTVRRKRLRERAHLGIRCFMRVGEQDVERIGTLPEDRADLPVLAPRLSKSTAPEPSSTSISETSLSLSRTTGLAGDSRSRPLPSFGTQACTATNAGP